MKYLPTILLCCVSALFYGCTYTRLQTRMIPVMVETYSSESPYSPDFIIEADFKWISTKKIEAEKVGRDFKISTDPDSQYMMLKSLLERVNP